MKKYTSRGVVFGNLWGSGKGSYPAQNLSAMSKQKLISEAKKMLADGTLDAGMGFESLYGAYLVIKITDTKIIKGKEYVHDDYDEVIIGNLTPKEIDWSVKAIYE